MGGRGGERGNLGIKASGEASHVLFGNVLGVTPTNLMFDVGKEVSRWYGVPYATQ